MKPKWMLACYAIWILAFAVGLMRDWNAFRRLNQAIGQTDRMTRQILDDSERIARSTRAIESYSRQTEYLRSLVTLLPETKSFIRTQRAMAEEVEQLRDKVGRRIKNDLHILVDTRANKLYVKKGLTLLWEADCSVGKGGLLRDKVTGRKWEFVTPRGQFDVRDKIAAPVWTKPDWAFVEERKPVPPPEDPSRHVAGELGAYVFNLGDGYLIHGTKDETVLGHAVSHGCVRLGAADLKRLYETVPRWTRVYIY